MLGHLDHLRAQTSLSYQFTLTLKHTQPVELIYTSRIVHLSHRELDSGLPVPGRLVKVPGGVVVVAVEYQTVTPGAFGPPHPHTIVLATSGT